MIFQLASTNYRGYATNMCFNADCTDPLDTAPDYFFDNWKQLTYEPPNFFNPATDPYQTIETSGAVNSATVVVSSRDYGGSAKLTAAVSVNGITMYAGVAETQELFARIPIDKCRAGVGCRPNGDPNEVNYYSNGIADDWESQFGRYLNAYEDDEEGWPGSNSRGDGYIAHDEYRGFIIWDGSNVVHVRTNPAAVKDVFLHDGAGIIASLRALLDPRTAPYLAYYQILEQSARFKPPPAPANSVGKHNWNGIGTNQAFAMVYVDPGGSTCPAGQPELGNAGSFVNDGTTPISIYYGVITACANGELHFSDPEVLRAQVVAHETAHKLGLLHPLRLASFANVVVDPDNPSSVASLGYDQFATQGSYTLYPWSRDYIHPAGSGIRVKAEQVTNGGALNLNTEATIHAPVDFYRANASDDIEVVRVAVDNAISIDPATGNPYGIFIKTQNGYIMDWTPRRTLQTLPEWNFAPGDLEKLCPKQSCP